MKEHRTTTNGDGLAGFLLPAAANTAPPGRPKADGLVLVAAHPGQGAMMPTGIYPSVVDEDELLAVDPGLDV